MRLAGPTHRKEQHLVSFSQRASKPMTFPTYSIAVLGLALLVAVSLGADADNTGILSPTCQAGPSQWINPMSALSDGSGEARADNSYSQGYAGFDLSSIPAGSTIDSVVVYVDARLVSSASQMGFYISTDANRSDSESELEYIASVAGTEETYTLTFNTFSAGSTIDSDFKTYLTVIGFVDSGGSVYVDWIRLEVNYTPETTPPNVTDVSVSDTLISDADCPGTFDVVVTFDEPMTTSAAPSLAFNGTACTGSNPDPIASGSLTFSSGAWSSGDTVYTATYTTADTWEWVWDIDITVTGGQDVAGNTMAPSTTDDVFEIDTADVGLTSITPSDTIVSDADSGGTFSLTLLFNTPMNTSVTPTVALAPNVAGSGTLTSSGGGWSTTTHANDTYTANYTVADVGEDASDVDVTVDAAKANSGNGVNPVDRTKHDLFDVDTENPSVVSVTVDDLLISQPDVGGTFTVTVDFSEDMDVAVEPSLSFSPAHGGTLTGGTPNWLDNDTFTMTYTVTDQEIDIDHLQIDVEGAKDAAGNPQQNYAPENESSIDTLDPVVADVQVSDLVISEADAGGTFTVEVTFNEVMRDVVNPAIAFVPALGSSGALTLVSEEWINGDQTFRTTYTIADTDETATGVDVVITGALDYPSNPIAPNPTTIADVFDVDTEAPWEPSRPDLHSSSDTYAVYSGPSNNHDNITYDTTPRFDGDAEANATVELFSSISGSLGATSVENLSNWSHTVGTPMVDGAHGIYAVATDPAGNTSANSRTLPVTIDTQGPSLSSVTISDGMLTESDTGSTVWIRWILDEASSTYDADYFSSSPIASGTLVYSRHTWSDTTYHYDTITTYYTVVDVNEETSGIDIGKSIWKDVAGNDLATSPDFVADLLDIDMAGPSVSNVSVSDTLISDADAGNTFTVTVDFSEGMTTDGSADPTLIFSPAVGSTLSSMGGNWPDSDTYLETYTIADAGVDVDSVTIDVTSAKDAAGNDQQDYTPVHEFEIDTENPTVISFWQSDDLLTDADVGPAAFQWFVVFSETMSGPRPSTSYGVTDSSFTFNWDSWSSTNVSRDTYTRIQNVHDENATWIDRDIHVFNDAARPTTHCIFDPAGNPLEEYWVYDAFTIDTENPSVTINQAPGQADPTNTSPTTFTVVFDEPINDATFTGADVNVGGTATTGTVTVTEIAPNDDTTFEVSIPVIADGTVIPTIPAVRAQDAGGNNSTASTSTDNDVTYDTTAPTDPTPSSSSHTVGVWSNDDTVDIAISGASDTGSGVDGFEVEWDQSATWTPTETKEWEETWSGTTLLAMSNGNWYFHIATVDNAGNWTSTQHLGPFRIDEAAPYSPILVGPGTTNDTSPTLSWTDRGDLGGSGVGIYSKCVVYGTPNSSSDWIADTTYTPTLAEGEFTWSATVMDNAGNNSPYPAWRTLIIDITDPIDPTLSSTSHVVGVASSDSTVDIAIAGASDPTSNGVSSSVYGFETAWDQSASWIPTETKNQSSGWTGGAFTATADGDWYFHIATTDWAGNWTSTQHLGPFPIDLGGPTVSSVSVSDVLIDDADTGGTFTVTVDFSEAMTTDGSADPTLIFSPAVGSTLSSMGGNWPDSDTYLETYTIADAGVDVDSVTIDVTSAKDAAGNDQQDYTPVHEFEIDTENPYVLHIDVWSPPLSNNYEEVEFHVQFSESVTGVVLGNFSVDASGGQTAASLSRISGSASNRIVFVSTVEDQEGTVSVDMDTLLDDVQDSVGNPMVTPFTNGQSCTVDRVDPEVTGVTSSLLTIADRDHDATLAVTVLFSEDMWTDGTHDPSLAFDPDVGSTVSFMSGAWLASDTYEALYNIADANIAVDDVKIDVEGALDFVYPADLVCNPQADYTPESEFDIDMLNPTVTSVSVSDTLISDADVGGTFTVTVDFSEAMTTDGSVDPALMFSPDVGTTLSPTGGSWPTSDTYEATYTVSDANVDEDSVTIDVSGAKDAAGNPMEDCTPEHEFEIDTVNPTVVTLVYSDSPNDNLITDADVGDANSGGVSVLFSEPMLADGSADPVFTFNPNVDSTLPPAGSSGYWHAGFDDTSYGWYTAEADANVDIDSVMVDVAGAKDAAGNPMVPYTPEHELAIDTLNPEVVSVTVDTNPVYEHDLTQFVTITFDEEMDTSLVPTVSFSHGTWTSQGDGEWEAATGYIMWEETFTLTDNNEEFYDQAPGVDVVTVDVTGAKDAAGNEQIDCTPEPEFDIDTLQPTLIDATSTSANGRYTTGESINIALTFSEGVWLTCNSLKLLLDVGGARATVPGYHLLSAHWSTLRDTVDWLTYVVASDEHSLDLTLLGYETTATNSLLDWAGNTVDFGMPAPGANIADHKDIVVDTVAPAVDAVSVSDTLISDADAGGTFTITVDFSEAMTSDGTADPTLVFSPVVDSTLSATGGSWADSDTYEATYSIADADVDVDSVMIDVSGAKDAAGSDQQDYTPEHAFGIDTLNPTATRVSFYGFLEDPMMDPPMLCDEDTGHSGDPHWPFRTRIQVRFSEPMIMDGSADPSLSFVPNVDSTLSPSTGDFQWDLFRIDLFGYRCDFEYDPIDVNVFIAAVGVSVEGACDTSGNPMVPANESEVFGIDTENPTVSSVSVSDTVIHASSGTFAVTINYSEAMEDWSGFHPTLTFTPDLSTTLALSDGSWQDPDTFRVVYNVVDADVAESGIDIGVSGGRDLVRNEQVAYSIADQFDVDSVDPVVAGVSVSDTLISDADDGGTITVTVDFSEGMTTDGSVDPALTFSPDVGTTLSPTGGSWIDSDTYEATYTVSDANVDEDSVTIDVSGAKDAAGNDQQDYTPEHAFAIDTVNPTVVTLVYSDSPNDNLITDADVGDANSGGVSVLFSEPMLADGSADPVFTFSPNVDSTLPPAGSSGYWHAGFDDTSYGWYTAEADANVDIDSVMVDVAGAKDAAGNPMVPYMAEHEFAIDTENPTVASISVSDTLISDADDCGTFTVTVNFSEAMISDGSADPTIAFSPSVGSTLSATGGSWADSDTYEATYSIADADVDVDSVMIDVSGAKDAVGNDQEDYMPAHAFEIDTLNPTLLSFERETPATNPTNADYLTFLATFDEPMINVDLWDFEPSASTSGWNCNQLSPTIYRISIGSLYGNLPSFNGSVGVNLRPDFYIRDVAGNFLPAGEPAVDEEFILDNSAPTIINTGGYTNPVNDADLTFETFVEFDEPMDPSAVPVYDFGGGTWSSDGVGVWSNGNQKWSQTFTLEDNDEEFHSWWDISGTRDLVGHPQNDYDPHRGFSVDTKAPSVVAVEVNTATVNDLNLEIQVTVTFSEGMSDFPHEEPVIAFGDSSWASIGDGRWEPPGPEPTTWVETFTVLDADEEHSGVTIDVTNARDRCQNPVQDYLPENEFDIDTKNPTVVSIAALDTTPTHADTISWQIVFSEDVQDFNHYDLTFTRTGTVAHDFPSSVVTGAGNTYTYTLPGITGDGTISLVVHNYHTIEDLAGNPREEAMFIDGEYTIDNTPPEITDMPADIAIMALAHEATAVVTWTEPIAADSGSGIASFSTSHVSGTAFPIGATTVTYTAQDAAGNTATSTFDVTVSGYVSDLVVTPQGTAGDGGFLDHARDPDEDPLTVGEYTISGCYEVGEAILGACGLCDREGRTLVAGWVIVDLYHLTFDGNEEHLDQLSHEVITYDWMTNCYSFSIDTSELAPGYYIVYLAFPDGTNQEICIEVTASAST